LENELIIVGELAPDFSLMADSGHKISLSSYRNSKNVVLYFMREFN